MTIRMISGRMNLIAGAAALGMMLAAGAASADAPMKAPQKVQKSLATLNRVVDHTARLIQAKNYAHLLHENNEFKEGSEALEKSIAKEPADFKAKVDPLLKQADSDSQSIADAATAKDDGKLATSHEALSTSVKTLLAAFPDSVQPPAPSVTKELKEDESQDKK
jgi:hypothetical protein